MLATLSHPTALLPQLLRNLGNRSLVVRLHTIKLNVCQTSNRTPHPRNPSPPLRQVRLKPPIPLPPPPPPVHQAAVCQTLRESSSLQLPIPTASTHLPQTYQTVVGPNSGCIAHSPPTQPTRQQRAKIWPDLHLSRQPGLLPQLLPPFTLPWPPLRGPTAQTCTHCTIVGHSTKTQILSTPPL